MLTWQRGGGRPAVSIVVHLTWVGDFSLEPFFFSSSMTIGSQTDSSSCIHADCALPTAAEPCAVTTALTTGCKEI